MLGLVTLVLGCSGTSGTRGTPGFPGPTVGDETPLPREGQLLVKVGTHGGGITEADFQAVAVRTPPDGPVLTLAQRQKILDDLVEQELLFQEAFARGLYRDPKVKRALVQQLLRSEVLGRLKSVDLPEEELQAYYDSHRSEFLIPEKADVKRIFLRVDATRTEAAALALAADLRRQIQADPSKFKALAEQYSDDAYKRRGGAMGYIDRVADSPHPPELLEKVFSIEIGRVSEPFVAGGGVNLVVVNARREAIDRTFEQVKGTVIRQMKSQRFEAASDAFVAALKAGTAVEMPSDEVLQSLKVELRGAPAAPEGKPSQHLLEEIDPSVEGEGTDP